MELCLMVEGQEGVTWTEWVALARTCEAHGIPRLFRSDHYLNLGGVAERGSLDAWGTGVRLGGHRLDAAARNGGRRSCRLAARYGDEYNTVFPTLEDVATRRERLARACEAEGRPMLRFSGPMLPFSVMTGVLVGADEAELGDRAARLQQRIGMQAGSPLRDPPSGWIVGTTERATEQLRGLPDAGVDRVFCQHLLHDDLDPVALIGERLAPEVAGTGQPA
jgi:alkanesulfonate monooxygenase SsuD/methylene tetrahydromethanopterin reductase-like flavin-dependent oxidoreductase (luciferase family)